MGARRADILWNAIQLFPGTSHEREYDNRIALSCLRDLHYASFQCASTAFDQEYNASSVPLGHISPTFGFIVQNFMTRLWTAISLWSATQTPKNRNTQHESTEAYHISTTQGQQWVHAVRIYYGTPSNHSQAHPTKGNTIRGLPSAACVTFIVPTSSASVRHLIMSTMHVRYLLDTFLL